MKAIVLLSGGMDSATCATLAAKKHGASEVGGISIIYGQTHVNEVQAAERVANALQIHHKVVTVNDVFAGYGSSIVAEDNAEMPNQSYEELHDSYGVSPTYVPYRNGTFLSLATIDALIEGAEEIWFGAHAEDAHNWAYPDCTPEFIGAMANAIYIGTYHKVRLITPLQWMTKTRIAQVAVANNVPLWLTLSCYRGEDPACGTCPTCVGRRNAFKMAGLSDPIEYKLPGVSKP